MNDAVPGHVDYGLNHGAILKVDIEDRRFVFFYMPVDFRAALHPYRRRRWSSSAASVNVLVAFESAVQIGGSLT